MKLSILILIPVVLVAGLVAVLIQPDNEVEQIPITLDIEDKLKKIEEKRLENNENNDYDPTRTREWLTSGPFQVDRSVYYLGEKIFINAENLKNFEEGQILIVKEVNSTHFKNYYQIPFDGQKKSSFNVYIEPKISMERKICSVNDIIGDWQVLFNGTSYLGIKIKFLNQTIPGDEDKYIEKVC